MTLRKIGIEEGFLLFRQDAAELVDVGPRVVASGTCPVPAVVDALVAHADWQRRAAGRAGAPGAVDSATLRPDP